MTETTPSKPELGASSLSGTHLEGDTEDNHATVDDKETNQTKVKFCCICCLLLLPLIGGITYVLLYLPKANDLSSKSGAQEGIAADNSNEIIFQPSTMINIPNADIKIGSEISLVNSRSTFSNFNWGANTFLKQEQIRHQGGRIQKKPGTTAFYLQQQGDGNLVLYDEKSHIYWNSGVVQTPSNKKYYTILQSDGNLVTYSRINNGSPHVEWASNSPSRIDNYNLVLTPGADGLMIARRNNGQIIWSTVAGPAFGSIPAPAPAPNPDNQLSQISPWPQTVSRSRTYSLQSGPLMGHTTQDFTKIWVHLGQNVPMQLVYWPYSSNGEMKSVNTLTLVPDLNANGAAFRNIEGLRADTTYLYEVRINGEWIAQGHFKTAPRHQQATSFKYLLASCMNVKSDHDGYTSQPVWNEALKRNIDFAMLPGDTVYLNNEDRESNGEVKYDRVWYR